MTANVWKVLVAAGDTVSDGDTLVILESMKMEHEIRARTDGVVSAVSTAEGAQVAPNALLLTIAAA